MKLFHKEVKGLKRYLLIRSSDLEDTVDIIYCVALFYEKGKSGNSFLRKEERRAELPRKAKTLKAVKETVW